MPEVTRVSESDRLFAQPQQRVADFVFNEDVVRVFPDMIKRSVPGYPTIVENIGVLGAQFAQPNSVLYDLGCSLGAVTQSLRRHVRNDGCRVIGVDNSHAMIERCSEYLHAQDAMYQELLPVELALLPGGALILSEKLRFADAQEHALLTDLHIAFKRANGYSELEIAQKRSALENVMLPDTFEEHRERLLAAGFSRVSQWFQCLNFASMIALP